MKRGVFVVVEGIDRTGKTSQCKSLVENLQKRQVSAQYMNFPNRETEIGNVINKYLTSKKELSDEAIHLLFSANRWEKADNIIKTLESGVSLIVDRYCYSGFAFSAAKGLDLNWCKSPDIGLPQPDLVFFLTMPLDIAEKRKGFGDERYEVLEFQKKVSNVFDRLYEDNWEVIDANRSIEDIQKELLEKTLTVASSVSSKPIRKMGLVWG